MPKSGEEISWDDLFFMALGPLAPILPVQGCSFAQKNMKWKKVGPERNCQIWNMEKTMFADLIESRKQWHAFSWRSW